MGTPNTNYWGFVLILFGLCLLLNNFNIMDFSYFVKKFQPLIFILIGLKIILNKKSNVFKILDFNDHNNLGNKNHNIINETNIFGDIKLDLSNIKPINNLTNVFISSVFGDISILTSKNIPIKVKTNAVAGDINIHDNSRNGFFPNIEFIDDDYNQAEKKIYIQSSLVFGSITVH